MKLQVEKMLSETRAELKSFANISNATTTQERQKLLVSMTQEFVRHLNDCVRGEYRDRLIVVNPRLRLYTRALGVFSELQARANAAAPPFRDASFVAGLARQMEQLRGRELPGFMSAQSFYMFIQARARAVSRFSPRDSARVFAVLPFTVSFALLSRRRARRTTSRRGRARCTWRPRRCATSRSRS